MKLTSYKILFRIFSFLSDKSNGAPVFVKYKLLLGTLIIGLANTTGKAQEVTITCYIATPEVPVEEVTCYKPVVNANAQGTGLVKGTVVDESGEPIIGCNVMLKNTTTGTLTDEKGKYSLEAKKKDIVIFSYIGLERREIRAYELMQKDSVIVLQDDNQILCYEPVIVPYKERPNPSKYSYYQVDQPPVSPVGDLNDFENWANENIQYSAQMLADKIEGEVTISFIINKKGKITNKKVLRKLSPEADAEAMRILSSSGNWKPGMHNGKAVKTIITIPVYFTLP